MAYAPSDSAALPLSDHVRLAPVDCNQRDHDASTCDASDALRRVLLQQGFTAKPTAYAPYGKQEDHPLHDPHRQLQARLQAVRDVRSKLRFVASSADTDLRGLRPSSSVSSSDNNRDVDMVGNDSMAITTRVALSAQTTTDHWVQRGGMLALDGFDALETLFLSFLTTHELVTAGAVCQSWYALARRDVLWEPLLHTPVENYPLRAFLGFYAAAKVPAIQVYIIYRKIRAQLQTLHAKDDETPRQSPDALRFEEIMLRVRRAGNQNNQNNNNDHPEQNLEHDDAVFDELAMLARTHGEDFLPPPLALPVLGGARRRTVRRGGGTTTATTTTTTTTRKLHLSSVHLVFPADEDLGAHDESQAAVIRDHDMIPLPVPPILPAARQQQERVHFFAAAHDVESDDENENAADGDGDVAMLAPDDTTARNNDQQQQQLSPPPPVDPQASVLDACRRVRLQTWLAQRRVVSRDEFRSFARQLLLALATLEVSQTTHSDVCVGNILVLERGTTQIPLPHASPSVPEGKLPTAATHDKSPQSHLPLFQLYCRSSVNIWTSPNHTQQLPPLRDLAGQPPAPPPPLMRAGGHHGDALAHRIRQRHLRLVHAANAVAAPPPLPFDRENEALRMRQRIHQRMALAVAVVAPPPPPPPPLDDGDDDEAMRLVHEMFPRFVAPPAWRPPNVVADMVFREAAAPLVAAPAVPPAAAPPLPMPIPAPVAPMPAVVPQAPSSANLTNMVRSYVRILREVWSHGRVATTNERMLPFLSLIFLRPELVKSVSFRSFVEYIEYLLSRNEATPTKLLHHIFVQHDDAATGSSPSAVASARFTIGRSGLSPLSFASAEDYRTNAIAWHGRYLASHEAQHFVLAPTALLAALGSFGSLRRTPSTLFGPAFFHDALSESRLPFQRFLSVAAPRTATSSWVHTLAVSQRFTLQRLDLSRVQLPLSIVLRELFHLQRLSHLRLPRAILRDENMEQFVAALWCSGLLPTLEVMDDSVKMALDRMEASYVTQLHIMSSFYQNDTGPSLDHSFSSSY